mgnify:CR=1 FL=1
MNQQEATIAVWRAMHQQMTDNFAAASVETQLLRAELVATKEAMEAMKNVAGDAKPAKKKTPA